MSVLAHAEPVTPTERETRTAKDSSRTLSLLLRTAGDREASVRITAEDGRGVEVTLPPSTLRLLHDALQEMAEGNAVALVSVPNELTTQQAADLIRVSRPFLIKLLEAGEIPYRRVGSHRRVRHQDVMRYLQQERDRRERVMRELADETDDLGI